MSFFIDVVPNLEQSLDHCSYCTYGFVGEQLFLQEYLTPSQRGFPSNQKLSAMVSVLGKCSFSHSVTYSHPNLILLIRGGDSIEEFLDNNNCIWCHCHCLYHGYLMTWRKLTYLFYLTMIQMVNKAL